MENDILRFISIFQSPSNKDLFTNCACYWFAQILHTRFENSVIVYDPDIVHFATKIEGKIYDITGELEETSRFIEWEAYKQHPDNIDDVSAIIRECIYFGGDMQ